MQTQCANISALSDHDTCLDVSSSSSSIPNIPDNVATDTTEDGGGGGGNIV